MSLELSGNLLAWPRAFSLPASEVLRVWSLKCSAYGTWGLLAPSLKDRQVPSSASVARGVVSDGFGVAIK